MILGVMLIPVAARLLFLISIGISIIIIDCNTAITIGIVIILGANLILAILRISPNAQTDVTIETDTPLASLGLLLFVALLLNAICPGTLAQALIGHGRSNAGR